MTPDFSVTPVEALLNRLKERQLLQSVLLFAVAHRPLAFVVGQGLYLLAPLSELAGVRGLSEWAERLCDVKELKQLEDNVTNFEQD